MLSRADIVLNGSSIISNVPVATSANPNNSIDLTLSLISLSDLNKNIPNPFDNVPEPLDVSVVETLVEYI